MVGRYFRCGRDADTSDGDVCFIVFHLLIFKLSLTCDESHDYEQETCDFLRYKMHNLTGYATKEARKLESLRYESVFS